MKNIFYLTQIKKEEEHILNIDESTTWMKDILHELQEDCNEKDKKSMATHISFNGSIQRKKDGKFGDYLYMRGTLKAGFCAHCVKSGNPMLDTIDLQIDSAILDNEIKERLRENEDIIYLDQNQLDIYYYQDNCFSMQQIIHEYLFLNKNPYPTL